MSHVLANAEESVRRCSTGSTTARSIMRWTMAHTSGSTSPSTSGRTRGDDRFHRHQRAAADNFNAPLSIVQPPSLYVVRTLIDDAIPMNDGCLRPIHIVMPDGSMLNPRYPAAVVAGNVETSQAVTDALYGALGVLAASQGTMNNFTFGNEKHQYYETIAGGAGAGPDFDGASAVQTHMTNSRLTDPEVLEWRFPVRLEAFAIRRAAAAPAAIAAATAARRVRFLEPMTG